MEKSDIQWRDRHQAEEHSLWELPSRLFAGRLSPALLVPDDAVYEETLS